MMKLTISDQFNIIKDFQEWSGGFDPEECPWDYQPGDSGDEFYVQYFIDNIVDDAYDRDSVQEFLEGYCGYYSRP